ncbi:MAG: GNAT family N-acetyltransferase [Muribaculaceae bacterium]|nr:GNAT family N-acetyltransferase [Muribaculaceae bacterium]
MEVRISSQDDIKEIVRVHLSAFPGFFLTELGEKFLCLYYRSVLEAPNGILLSCIDEAGLVGFCAACTRSAGFNSGLIKNSVLKFGIIGLQLLFTKPRAIIRLAKNLTKKGEAEDSGNYSELLSIGVTQENQGRGVGKLLLTRLETILKDDGVSQLSLTTDYDDNEQAIKFYSRIGFRMFYDFIAYPDRRMYRLIKDL